MKVGALLACALALTAAASAGTPPSPARLQVVAKEYTLDLSRQRIVAGPVTIELVNLGMDPHDLRLQRIGGKRVYAVAETEPGARNELDTKLLPGRYRVWCSIADHRMRGMHATLRVIPRKR